MTIGDCVARLIAIVCRPADKSTVITASRDSSETNSRRQQQLASLLGGRRRHSSGLLLSQRTAMASEAKATPDPEDFAVDDAVVRTLVLDYLVHNGART